MLHLAVMQFSVLRNCARSRCWLLMNIVSKAIFIAS